MNWLKRALLALLLVAAPAQATTYWMSPTGLSGNSGADSLANAKSLTWFVQNAAPGDVGKLAHGDYGLTNFNFEHSGTVGTGRIHLVGDITYPSTVILGSGTLSLFFYANDYISLKGFRVGGVDVYGGTAGSDGRANSDSLLSCVIDNSVGVGFSDSVVVMNNVNGTGDASDKWGIGTTGMTSTHFVASGNRMNLGSGSVGTNNAFQYYSMDGLQHLNNTVHTTSYADNPGIHTNTWYRVKNSTITDNSWRLLQDSPLVIYAMNLRDSTYNNTFLRDTVVVDSLSAGVGKIEFMTSGTFPDKSYSNVFSHCYFRPNGILGYQSGSNYDLHEFNQYISKRSFNFPAGNDTMIGMTFRHNTFVVTDPQIIDHADVNTDSTQAYRPLNNRFVSNIFYSNGSTQGYHLAMNWWSGAGVRDSNLVFCTTQDSANAYDRPSTDADAHSHWADPVFVNERWETADLTPSKKYLANSSDLWPDGYVGAIDPGAYTPALEVYQLVLPDAKVGQYYEVRLKAVNGASPYTWSLGAGGPSLPSGLTLDAIQGVISGTPDAEGTVTSELVVTDDLLATASRVFTISVTPTATTVPRWCRFWWCRIFGW